MKRWIWAVLVGLLVVASACAKESKDGMSKKQGTAGKNSEGTAQIAPPGVTDEKAQGSPALGVPEPMINRDAAGSGGSGGGGKAAIAPDRPISIPPLPEIPPSQAKVIKNANLEVRIKKGDFQSKFARANALAEEFGGYVSSTSVNETKGKLSSGTITLRVPADRFQAAVSRFKALGKVTAEGQSGQDVTREFVDLEARLRSAKSQEAFYLRLLDQSKSVSDMIQVQQQLTQVQMQIEQIQGQMQYLKDQTGYSTITARIYEPGAAARETEPQPLRKAWAAAVNASQRVMGGFVVALGWLAPFGLLAAASLLVWRIYQRSRNKPVTPPVP